jgi:hypothetical protein
MRQIGDQASSKTFSSIPSIFPHGQAAAAAALQQQQQQHQTHDDA